MNALARPELAAVGVACTVNGRPVRLLTEPHRRLTEALRLELGLAGTKVGCDAGDCGACTVHLDGRQVCGCLVPVGQLEGRAVTTVEGLARDPRLARLRTAFVRAGAAQCGICTPGMLMAAAELMTTSTVPDRGAVEDTIGGVLCRCTGYTAIVDAVLDAFGEEVEQAPQPAAGAAVGARVVKLDGAAKVDGRERYGADHAPPDALWLRVVRSPHAHARVTLGDFGPLKRRHPGLVRVLTHADVPGANAFGIMAAMRDQPVLAPGIVRHRGEPVLALVGDAATLEAITTDDLPLTFEPLPAVDFEAARQGEAPDLHPARPGNVLTVGRVRSGDLEEVPADAIAVTGTMRTAFVEHAYIEPEAGWAGRVGDRLEIHASTQAPYMDRDETAHVLGLAPEQVRVVPTACGGGFGGKLDLSVQPLLALAAWLTGRPVRTVWSRVESMAASTKRHPSVAEATLWVAPDGSFEGLRYRGDFDTGAYASWGPTVAGRVPVHCTGPYRMPRVEALARAVHTNGPPSGAFRGFGVPQALLLTEGLIDDAATRLGRDPLELRLQNALRNGDRTATGQRLESSVGQIACLEALQPAWRRLRADAQARNADPGPLRAGVGIASVWYGCGNTGLSNPSSQRVTLHADGRLTFWNGVQDIGQGSATIMPQILADALGLPIGALTTTTADTDHTDDCGKTSASRQTFVSGRATQLAGEDLRAQVLRLANAGPDARLSIEAARLHVRDGDHERVIELASLPRLDGYDGSVVLEGRGRFDPPTTGLDAHGQGSPYAAYGFGAQIAAVTVDTGLGTVNVEHIEAAYDVGRAVNPQQIEGQIMGGIAQGLGLALMEAYEPGRTENLHDYLVPTFGDMPNVAFHLIEEADPLGPFGAKGVGEHALIPTAPAILNAIADAVGVRPDRVPVLPHRLFEALEARGMTR